LKVIRVHTLATLFPPITGEEFTAFADSIETEGLREAIVTLDGEILDGRNRLRACQDRGIEPRFVEFEPAGDNDTPLAFVIRQNLRRRHLTDSQRAMIAARLADHPGSAAPGVPKRQHAREGKVVAGAKADGRITKADAAAMLGVSQSHVRMAREVINKAPPEAVAKVDAGEVKVGTAWRTEVEEKRPLRAANQTADRRARPSDSQLAADGRTHAVAPEIPLVREIFDWIERQYERERELIGLPSEDRADIVREFAELLGIEVVIGTVRQSSNLIRQMELRPPTTNRRPSSWPPGRSP
jgi:ParB-like chromosome segregation protein Spo0J